MKNLLRILPIIFLLFVITVLTYAAATRPRVLIVMSYSLDNPWEKQIRQGIDKWLGSKAPFLRVHYFYLDTLNHPEKYIQNNVHAVKSLIKSYHPQVLLLVDDNAQQLVGIRYLNKPGISLVFSGVNADPAIYGYKPHENVTGIIENLHYSAMQNAILRMFPAYKKIIHLCDNSFTSQLVQDELLDHNWRPLQILGSYKVNTIQQWLEIVDKANQQNTLLLLTHFQSITDNGKLVAPNKLIEITLQRAHVPILDFFNFTVDEGVPMALSTSGYEQGQAAAELTMQILIDKQNAGDIPFKKSEYFDFSLNQKSIKINMPWVKIPETYRSLAYLQKNLRDE